MTIEELASDVVEACEAEMLPYMVAGAFAFNLYGVPRSTKDFDIVLDLSGGKPIQNVIKRLEPLLEFEAQVQFDTLTWGKRQVGVAREGPPLKVELFERFDDPFVDSQFSRRVQMHSQSVGRKIWLPTPEDVVVQKLRWGRGKDLDDARDVLAVQGIESLDMNYIQHWCGEHGTSERLQKALDQIPPLD